MILHIDTRAALKQLTTLCHFIEYSNLHETLYITINNVIFYLNFKRKDKYYKQTKLFSISIKGQDKEISYETDKRVNQIIIILNKIENSLNHLKAYHIWLLIVVIIRFPNHFNKIIQVFEKISLSKYYYKIALQDFQFLLFNIKNLNSRLTLNRIIKKENIIKSLNNFKHMPHIFIIGDGRSGTRWLKEIIIQLIRFKYSQVTILNETIMDIDLRLKKNDTRGENNMLSFFHDQNLFYTPTECKKIKIILKSLAYSTKILFTNKINFDPRFLVLFSPANHIIISKIHYYLLEKFKNYFNNAFFYIIQRDPRNIYISQKSYFKNKLNVNFKTIIQNQILLNQINETNNIIKLKYENLVIDINKSLNYIMEKLNITISNENLSKIIDLTSYKYMSNGNNYGEIKNGNYFRGGSNWKTEMTENEQESIKKNYSNELKILGYKN